MSDDVLTADQLNYAGQPLINLVIDLQHNILNVANGLWNRGYRDYPLDNIISILGIHKSILYSNDEGEPRMLPPVPLPKIGPKTDIFHRRFKLYS